ncbi:MAG: hypothetical protein ACHQUA_00605 [Microgenomates group bacterium]
MAQGFVFLHGLSGAGKGELKAKILEAAEKEEVRVFDLASGDCFRAIDKKIKDYTKAGNFDLLNEEEKAVARQMAEGKQIPGLQTIAPPVIDTILEYVDVVVNGGKAILILDGFLRNGEDIYKDKPESEATRLPSQILQVGEMLSRALKTYFYGDEGDEYKNKRRDELIAKGIVDMNFVIDCGDKEYVDYKEVSDQGYLAEVVDGLRKDSEHAIVDVLPEDAEALMRFRSALALRKLVLDLSVRDQSDERVERIENDLLDILKLQTGRFEIKEGKVELDTINSSGTGLDSYGLDKDKAKIVDTKLREITDNIFSHLGVAHQTKEGKPRQMKDALGDIKTELGLGDEFVFPRYDDLPHLSRITRIEEFFNKALPGVIEGELGVKLVYDPNDPKKVELDFSEAKASSDKTIVIANGPARGIGINEYKADALLAGMFLYTAALGKEGAQTGAERRGK